MTPERSARLRIDAMLERGGPTMVAQGIWTLPERRLAAVEWLARFPDESVAGAAEAAAVLDEARTGVAPVVWFALADLARRRLDLELAAVRNALPLMAELPPGVYGAINCSPETIRSPDLRRLIARWPAADVMIELTEHHAVSDYDALAAALRALHVRTAAGARRPRRLSLDDVGAGENSLRTVRVLGRMRALDVVKVDMTLIRGIDSDPGLQSLVEGIVRAGTAYSYGTIAEGVETWDELAAVTRLGCAGAQGYLADALGPPAPLASILAEAAAR